MDLYTKGKQRFLGINASINKQRLPVVFVKVKKFKAPIILDYGCGRYIDHIRKHVESMGKKYLPFDPFNMSRETNEETQRAINEAIEKGIPVDVVCSNVLNMIEEDSVIQEIAFIIMTIVLRTKGTAYITAHYDKRYPSGVIAPDRFQRNVHINDYLRFFPGAEAKYNVIRLEGDRVHAYDK